MENHSKDVGTVTLVQIPIVGNADLEFFHLNLFAYVVNVRSEISAELHGFYNFVQKMLVWTNYWNTRVVLILWFLRILLLDLRFQKLEWVIVELKSQSEANESIKQKLINFVLEFRFPHLFAFRFGYLIFIYYVWLRWKSWRWNRIIFPVALGQEYLKLCNEILLEAAVEQAYTAIHCAVQQMQSIYVTIDLLDLELESLRHAIWAKAYFG